MLLLNLSDTAQTRVTITRCCAIKSAASCAVYFCQPFVSSPRAIALDA